MANKAVGLLTFNIGANLSNFEKNLNKAEKSLKRLNKNLTKVGKSMTMGLTVPVLGLGAASTKVFMDFEQSMLKVKAVSGATEKEFSALKDSAKALGSSTMFSASQVGELQLELSKLGMSVPQILNSTDSVLKLAQATDIELGQAAETTAVALNAFSLSADESARVADVFAFASSNAAVDMEKLQAMLPNVAAVAKASGDDLEGLTAKIMTLADKTGMEGGKLGTHMKIIYQSLAKNGLTYEEAMEKIRNSTDKVSVATELFGRNAFGSAIALSEVTDKTAEYDDQLRNSEGTAQGMADTMDSGLGGSVRKLKSQMEGLAITIGETLAPIVEKLVEKVGSAIDWFQSLDEGTRQNILMWIGVAAAIGPVIFLFGKLVGVVLFAIKAIKIIRKGMLLFNAVMAANPVVLVILAIVGLIAVFVTLYNKVDVVRGVMHGLFKAAKAVFSGLWKMAKNVLGGIGDIIIGIFTLDTGRIRDGFRSAKKGVTDYGSDIADAFNEGYEDGLKAEPITMESLTGFSVNDLKIDAKKTQVSGDEGELDVSDMDLNTETDAVNVPSAGGVNKPSGNGGGADNPFEIDLKALERNHKLAIIAHKQNLLDGVITKDQFNKLIRDDELTHLNDLKTLNEKYKNDVIDINEDIVDKKQEIFDATPVREFEGVLGSLGDTIAEFTGTDIKKLEDGFVAVMSKLGDELSQGADSFKEYAQNVKNALRDTIGALISQGVAAAVSKAMMSTTFLPPFLIPVVAGLAGGLAKTAFNSLIPQFAEGGLVTGATLGLIGEGAGTSVSNPEVVAPLDKLKGMMGGGGPIVVEGKIKGKDIWISNKKTNFSRNRTV